MSQYPQVFSYKNIVLIGVSDKKHLKSRNVWQGISILSHIITRAKKNQVIVFVYGPMTKRNFMVDNRDNKAQCYGIFEWMLSPIELSSRLYRRKKYSQISQDVLDILCLMPFKNILAPGLWKNARIYTIHINSIFCKFCSQLFWSTIVHELLHARAFMSQKDIKASYKGITSAHKKIDNYVHNLSEEEFDKEFNRVTIKLAETIEKEDKSHYKYQVPKIIKQKIARKIR